MLGFYLCPMAKQEKTSRKHQLELTATQLFKEKGYTASSMRDLANEVGIEAASLYSHIKSKEEILRNICFRMAGEFFAAIDSIDNKSIDSMAQKLENYIIAHTEVIARDTAATLVFINEWKHLSEPHYTNFNEQRHRYEKRFIEILKEGIKRKEFLPIDEKFVVLTILSSLNWIPHWYNPAGKMSPGEIGRQLSRMLINGIKA